MKFRLFLVATVSIFAYSCTKVVEAPVDENEITNLSTARKALLFKFTGVNCGACTAYHPIYEGCLDTNAGKMVGLHVHCGVDDTLNTSFSLWFTNAYDIPGTPRFSEGSFMKQDTSWGVARSAALATIDKPADVGIGIHKSVSGNTMNIKVKTQCFKDLPSGEYNMAIYIVENGCWADQVGAGNIQHSRVLRGSANGMWGSDFTATSKGGITDHSFTYNLGTIGVEYWNASNLEVVAVIYKMNGADPVEVINCNTTNGNN
ncbi:MAG: Omp28-related outer membrane protein [Bacteroidia bacterium]|nr:Omp28-related outer membrane protein [Bacteroidia bacterium]